jgi:hypothetical protein
MDGVGLSEPSVKTLKKNFSAQPKGNLGTVALLPKYAPDKGNVSAVLLQFEYTRLVMKLIACVNVCGIVCN